ncbi:NAD(P)H-quinone oxidoreductase [Tianweitania sediminis]|uniref:NAD(P)H-quinone oxidoreductase n=2 Tax=Tianweitania sediminis TaxID=1502156 RepID=A0A8J7UIE3_9HYPH|nr:NAD(P)H-quinone oxidoreductase [Tianweitania sediminis]
MTATMKHVVLKAPGPATNMYVAEGPRPQPGPGEVLIKVRAAGVNRPDISQRLGNYPPPAGVTEIMGLEVAGEVEQVGDGVDAWQPGDKVCALVAGGGYAEYVAAPAPQVLRVPNGMDFTTAAAIPETYFTVWTNVFQSGALKPGESILVHGGASGIGTTAIRLAHALGSRVYATVSSGEKAAVCRSLGATEAIDYHQEKFADRILELTGGGGVDVILDMRGGPFFAENMRAIATRGRIVHIASLAGREVTLDIPTLMRKRVTVTGSTLRARSVEEKGEIACELRDRVWPLFDAGTIAPEIFRVMPMSEVIAAHELVESNTHIGKVVLAM